MIVAQSSLSDAITPWLNLGVTGLVIVSLLTGLLWTRPSVEKLQAEKDRAVAEKEKAEAQRDAMAGVLQEKFLPVLSEFVSTTRTLLPILQQLNALQALAPILRELEQEVHRNRDREPGRRR